MKIEEIRKKELNKCKSSVSARLPTSYKNYIKKNKINLRLLIMKAVDELRA